MQIKFTADTIKEVAREIWNKHSDKKIWTFDAPMGAGKTTFIKALCNDVLQSKDVVSSPTFAIINEYRSDISGKIYHMDWYRLEDEEEAVNAGVEDALQSGALCLVEWSERAPLLLPDDALHLRIDILSETEREIFL
ncbi:tRNA (N6-adenosine(37)-N6)-threonylcarbamoyltransferase complex ATPase TsaE [Arachidicoccus ginsenosidimutans]|uniref:tRNA (adenosine(37)-N6)-threonylcarbamoyltransferase complex ATPase subunit type 1 TsaE n=1 Tax=Arachidicoccus sp. BS20 TaxID=1850526 RepID=UPI0007F112F2|nr:tRNA (adenosine(37)-N6)-threonylcarbamoyltransferase complex ATPase subunit type 1 TsaE [Arachidicoccus sp. BS20]ANI89723.1 tRNA (N6-adenosine(37)-N6)-threonylcarbamoyltransferase complex ATPase TsaE [Arachidicoccus sp. BS20]